MEVRDSGQGLTANQNRKNFIFIDLHQLMVKPDSNRSEVTRKNVLRTISEQSDSAERREFIKSTLGLIGGSLSGVFGLSTPATAADPAQRDAAKAAAKEFSSKKMIREAVQRHASGILTELFEQGYVDRPAVSALSLKERHGSVEAYVENSEGTFVSASPTGGEPRVKVRIKQRLSKELELVLTIEPQTEKSQAVLQRLADGSTVLVIRSDADDDVTTLEDCSYCETDTVCSSTCGPYICSCEEIEMRHSCQDEGCSYCKTISYECCGDYECNL
jgi:hypothetical protein